MTDDEREASGRSGGRFNLNDRERLVRLETVMEGMQRSLDALNKSVSAVPVMKQRLDSMSRALWLVAGALTAALAGSLIAYLFHVPVLT